MTSRLRNIIITTTMASGIAAGATVWANRVHAEPATKSTAADSVQKEPKFEVKPETRKFLGEHIKEGKTVDEFINAYNEQTKKMSSEMLGIIETIPKVNGNPQAASQLADIMDDFNRKTVPDLSRVIKEYMKESFYDYAIVAGFSKIADGQFANPSVSDLAAHLRSGDVISDEELPRLKRALKESSAKGIWPRAK